MTYFEKAIPIGPQDIVTLLPPGFTGSPNDGHLVTVLDADGTPKRDKTGEIIQVIEPGLAPDHPIRVEAEEYLEAQRLVREKRAQKTSK